MKKFRIVQDCVNNMLKESKDKNEIMYGTLRLNGTSLFAKLLAQIRKLDVELCAIAAMLYEYGIYKIKKEVNTRVCAAEAERLMRVQGCFTKEEIELVSKMILNCRNYHEQGDAYEDLLKDADILFRYLYIGSMEGVELYKSRIHKVLRELNVE